MINYDVSIAEISVTLPLKIINETIAVAPQLTATDMLEVAQAGYKSVIINRPDFEGGADQPPSSDVMDAARELGLQVEYQPVDSSAITHEDVVRFAQLYKQLPKPILAYCRSGGRCLRLFTAATELDQTQT